MAASIFLSSSPITPQISITSRVRIIPIAHILCSSKSHPPPPRTHLPSSLKPPLAPLCGVSSNTWCPLPTPPPPPAPPGRPHLLSLLAFAPLLLLMPGISAAAATADSIRASSIGLRIAEALRATGLPDGAIVFALAALPVLELRGAIPVGYWMQLHPLLLTALSIIGNMVPVPFILLYLRRLATFLSERDSSSSMAKLLEILLRRARKKAEPVKEFQWLGLMLFVAVPFPGTGAWTGAIVASVLDMPFWSAVSANFLGVVLAGLLVNLLVNLGLKYAIATGVVLFFVSTFMWSGLRYLKANPTS